MVSYNIPESVLGVPLFVPSANDFFSVDLAGMPNANNCLVVHGDISRDYKAYILAPTLVPDLLHDARVSGWSMVFWIKQPSYTTPEFAADTGLSSRILISAQASTFAPNNPSHGNNFDGDVVWAVGHRGYAGTGSGVTFTNNKAASSLGFDVAANTPADEWCMITVTKTASGAYSIFLNDNLTAEQSYASGSGEDTTGVANVYLCIGAYSDANANVDGHDQEFRIGKLSFHDRILNSTERTLLYDTMMAGINQSFTPEASDDFDRADEALNVSANWGGTITTSTTVTSNRVNYIDAFQKYGIWQTDMSGANHYAQQTVHSRITNASGPWCVVRYGSTDTECFTGGYNETAGYWQIGDKDMTVIDSLVEATPAYGYTQRLWAIGTMVGLDVNHNLGAGWENKIITFSSIATDGLGVGFTADRTSGTAIIDNFEAGATALL